MCFALMGAGIKIKIKHPKPRIAKPQIVCDSWIKQISAWNFSAVDNMWHFVPEHKICVRFRRK